MLLYATNNQSPMHSLVQQGRGDGLTTEPMFRLKVLVTTADGEQRTILTSNTSAFLCLNEWFCSRNKHMHA